MVEGKNIQQQFSINWGEQLFSLSLTSLHCNFKEIFYHILKVK